MKDNKQENISVKTTTKPVGLTSAQAMRQLQNFGPNRLPESKSDSWFLRFVNQFKDALIYLLLAALVIDLTI